MKPPLVGGAELWRRVAAAQDAAVLDPRTLRDLERAVAARVAAADNATVLGEVAAPPVPGRREGQPINRGLGKPGHQPHPLPPRHTRVWAVVLGTSLLASVAAAVLLHAAIRDRTGSGPRLPGTVAAKDPPLAPPPAPATALHQTAEQAFVADARSDLPLRFTDGSMVIFRAGSAGRMQRLTSSGAEIVLERGWLEAHVVHADTTLWLVHAGPFRVRVTGTRFAMTWAAASFELDLYEGAVVIDGSVLGAGVPLRAGQRLKVASGVVLIEPMEPGAAAPGDATGRRFEGKDNAPPESGESGSQSDQSSQSDQNSQSSQNNSDWWRLAERGKYLDAFAAAKRAGWNALCHRVDARRLLTLGDVARYSGAQVEARQAFEAAVTRFPDHPLAADAVFSLGRLAFESNRPGEASRWFRRYVADWPDAPLADQAVGRLVECAVRAEDRPAAQAAARRYLTRAPRGPHATLAREVLAAGETGALSRLRSSPQSQSLSKSPASSRTPLRTPLDHGQP
ncbi:MAG: tetratricopeptide repeat protein [Myxococcales bacterium]